MKNSNSKPGDQAIKNDTLFRKFRGGADKLFALSLLHVENQKERLKLFVLVTCRESKGKIKNKNIICFKEELISWGNNHSYL